MIFKRFIFNSFVIILIGIASLLSIFFLKTGFTFSKVSVDKNPIQEKELYNLPEIGEAPEQNTERINILLLGIRGEGKPFGGLLTDTIIIASFDKNTGKGALISLPRDLYVPLPGTASRWDKINAVYAWGYEKGGVGRGMAYIEEIVSRITGLYIDHIVVANFEAFERLVDAVGGVDIVLDKDFIEDKQWGCDKEGKNCWKFFLPAGKNHLDGKTALFYIRSRFSSSDFDRERRAQQVLWALKDRFLSLGFLTNPVKIFNLLDLLGQNVRTDMGLSDIKGLISLARSTQVDFKNIKNLVFDTSPGGFLYARYINNRYVLLPKSGNFDQIKEACQGIFQ